MLRNMGDLNAPLRVRVREGCRGGREQFTWNSIKEQDFKDREQYLGASTKVGMMGKLGKYYVHDWYARKRDQADSIESERSTVKAYEEELMQEALGLKPKRLMLAKHQMSEEEIKVFLKRDDEKRSDEKGMQQMGPQKKLHINEFGEQIETSNEEVVGVAAREAPVKGLGFALHRTSKLEAIKAEALGTESKLDGVVSSSSSSGAPKSEIKKDEIDDNASACGVVDCKFMGETDTESVKRETNRIDEPPSKKRKDDLEDREAKNMRKEEKKMKKAKKKLKKINKKLKKAAKKERKVAKRSKKDSDSSSSSSS